MSISDICDMLHHRLTFLETFPKLVDTVEIPGLRKTSRRVTHWRDLPAESMDSQREKLPETVHHGPSSREGVGHFPVNSSPPTHSTHFPVNSNPPSEVSRHFPKNSSPTPTTPKRRPALPNLDFLEPKTPKSSFTEEREIVQEAYRQFKRDHNHDGLPFSRHSVDPARFSHDETDPHASKRARLPEPTHVTPEYKRSEHAVLKPLPSDMIESDPGMILDDVSSTESESSEETRPNYFLTLQEQYDDEQRILMENVTSWSVYTRDRLDPFARWKPYEKPVPKHARDIDSLAYERLVDVLKEEDFDLPQEKNAIWNVTGEPRRWRVVVEPKSKPTKRKKEVPFWICHFELERGQGTPNNRSWYLDRNDYILIGLFHRAHFDFPETLTLYEQQDKMKEDLKRMEHSVYDFFMKDWKEGKWRTLRGWVQAKAEEELQRKYEKFLHDWRQVKMTKTGNISKTPTKKKDDAFFEYHIYDKEFMISEIVPFFQQGIKTMIRLVGYQNDKLFVLETGGEATVVQPVTKPRGSKLKFVKPIEETEKTAQVKKSKHKTVAKSNESSDSDDAWMSTSRKDAIPTVVPAANIVSDSDDSAKSIVARTIETVSESVARTNENIKPLIQLACEFYDVKSDQNYNSEDQWERYQDMYDPKNALYLPDYNTILTYLNGEIVFKKKPFIVEYTTESLQFLFLVDPSPKNPWMVCSIYDLSPELLPLADGVRYCRVVGTVRGSAEKTKTFPRDSEVDTSIFQEAIQARDAYRKAVKNGKKPLEPKVMGLFSYYSFYEQYKSNKTLHDLYLDHFTNKTFDLYNDKLELYKHPQETHYQEIKNLIKDQLSVHYNNTLFRQNTQQVIKCGDYTYTFYLYNGTCTFKARKDTITGCTWGYVLGVVQDVKFYYQYYEYDLVQVYPTAQVKEECDLSCLNQWQLFLKPENSDAVPQTVHWNKEGIKENDVRAFLETIEVPYEGEMRKNQGMHTENKGIEYELKFTLGTLKVTINENIHCVIVGVFQGTEFFFDEKSQLVIPTVSDKTLAPRETPKPTSLLKTTQPGKVIDNF